MISLLYLITYCFDFLRFAKLQYCSLNFNFITCSYHYHVPQEIWVVEGYSGRPKVQSSEFQTPKSPSEDLILTNIEKKNPANNCL